MEDKILKEHVMFGNHAVIKPTAEDSRLDQPLFAINWFNTNMKWIYNFYNFLAAPSVFKIGGKVFFKGETLKVLHGAPSDSRDVLLVVNYPSGKEFLNLMKDKIFLLVSLFREVAVRAFTFCFTRRMDSDQIQKEKFNSLDKSQHYAVQHFRMDRDFLEIFSQLEALSSSNNVKIHFAGKLTAHLLSENKNGEQSQMPSVLDGIVLYESDDSENFLKMAKSEIFHKINSQFESSFFASIKRTL